MMSMSNTMAVQQLLLRVKEALLSLMIWFQKSAACSKVSKARLWLLLPVITLNGNLVESNGIKGVAHECRVSST